MVRAAILLGLFLSLVFPARSQPETNAASPVCLSSGPTATGSGETLCIRKESYNRDLCVAIDHFAHAHDLPPDYFARLIWRESTFRLDALSPKGAEGIAQFMPATAKLRGLANSYDALQALQKSAEYLDELRDRFGNLGLAAAAYNAGENGLAIFLDSGRLPYETRSYVVAITGHTVEDWKDNPPDVAAAKLDEKKSFLDGCIALAESRRLREPIWQPEGVWAPWGAQIAAHFQVAVARRLFIEAMRKLPSPLNTEQPLIQRQRDRSFGFRPRYTARISRQTRAEADDVCDEVRKYGGACTVFKN
ncbi:MULTISPECIES: lytic transglycosylase domain-containing protein [unclassified Sinorhizobium]|uniref:lytic transglycosylase domain-containing protein n=1 Tax=unclassified Sinorhizobium TaxID=2613772 RepID=UPI003525126E